MYTIIILESVELKIQEIYDNLYRFSFSHNKSLEQVNIIYSSIYSLEIFPFRFQKYNDKYRVITIWKYRIFYRIDEKLQRVIILDIFSSKENYVEYLK